MSPLTLGLIGLAVSALAGGGVVAGVVLTTSGPLADSPGPLQQASPTPTVVSTPTPTPTQATVSTATPARTPAGARQEPDAQFDPSSLPAVDTIAWTTAVGPRGELTLRVPSSWKVDVHPQTDYSGQTVIGDAVKVLKVKDLPTGNVGFTPQPGDVWADLSTERRPIAYSTSRPVFYQLRYTRSVAGRPAEILATQFNEPENFDRGMGVLTLYASVPTPSGGFLIATVNIALPADRSTIAEAQAVLTEVTLK